MCVLLITSFCATWEGWEHVNWFNHAGWVAIVTPTDRLNSVGNSCSIKVFGGPYVLSLCFLEFSVDIRVL